MVCSPGGTTIEGVAALEEGGFRSSIIKACDANYEKNKRLKEAGGESGYGKNDPPGAGAGVHRDDP